MGRLDPRIGLIVGMLCIGISGVLMAQFDLDVPTANIAWMVVLQGIGCGILWVPLTIVTFATLPESLLSQGSAILHLLRNFGTSIFVSISVMLVTRTAKFNSADLSEGVSVDNETLRMPGVLGDWNIESLKGLAAIGGEIQRQARMLGYENAFLLYTIVCFAIIPLVLFIKVRQRRTWSYRCCVSISWSRRPGCQSLTAWESRATRIVASPSWARTLSQVRGLSCGGELPG
ncbi:MAG: DHA2 family multidrug resistance protein [Gammaproteobacteria bacterium]|jgi:DHA2 family multidrug resistance protein